MIGFDATSVLVASQVALSFELPFVLIPLVLFTKNREIMGDFQNYKITTYFLGLTIAFITVLNIWLIYSSIF
jgi:manganese transport protein